MKRTTAVALSIYPELLAIVLALGLGAAAESYAHQGYNRYQQTNYRNGFNDMGRGSATVVNGVGQAGVGLVDFTTDVITCPFNNCN